MVASMDGLGSVVKGIFLRMGDMMDRLWADLTALIRDSPRAACKGFIDLTVADFTTVCIDTSAAPGAGCFPAGEDVFLRRSPLMDLHVIPFGSVPSPAKAGDANDTEKAVADPIFDVSPSHLSAKHAVAAPSRTGSDVDRAVEVGQDLPLSGVASHTDISQSSFTGSMLSETKYATDTCSTLLTNQPSTAVASNRTVEAASPPRRDLGRVKRSGSRKELGE